MSDTLAGRDWVLTRRDLIEILTPPPPLDLLHWATENIRFGQELPFPGPFDPDRFPFYRRILEVLSPDHPARMVVLRGSAQIGKTVIGEIFLGGCQALDPAPFMVVHPTEGNVLRWIIGKWWPLVRNTAALAAIYDYRGSKEGGSSRAMQERRDGGGLVIFSGANSAASLSQVSVKRQLQDDLSWWQPLKEGDPEGLADDRSKAFIDAKIFKTSTPNLEHDCRVSEAYRRGTQEKFHVPCPHCDFYQPLEWADFKTRIDSNPTAINFVCPACGGLIEERHRFDIVRRGRWVADRPGAEILSFSIWSIYAGLESWATIAATWLAAKGAPADEKRVDNQTGGEPYSMPGDSPPWAELQQRAEASGRPRGLVPQRGVDPDRRRRHSGLALRSGRLRLWPRFQALFRRAHRCRRAHQHRGGAGRAAGADHPRVAGRERSGSLSRLGGDRWRRLAVGCLRFRVGVPQKQGHHDPRRRRR